MKEVVVYAECLYIVKLKFNKKNFDESNKISVSFILLQDWTEILLVCYACLASFL
jgi:hypothetical protein